MAVLRNSLDESAFTVFKAEILARAAAQFDAKDAFDRKPFLARLCRPKTENLAQKSVGQRERNLRPPPLMSEESYGPYLSHAPLVESALSRPPTRDSGSAQMKAGCDRVQGHKLTLTSAIYFAHTKPGYWSIVVSSEACLADNIVAGHVPGDSRCLYMYAKEATLSRSAYGRAGMFVVPHGREACQMYEDKAAVRLSHPGKHATAARRGKFVCRGKYTPPYSGTFEAAYLELRNQQLARNPVEPLCLVE